MTTIKPLFLYDALVLFSFGLVALVWSAAFSLAISAWIKLDRWRQRRNHRKLTIAHTDQFDRQRLFK